VYSPAEFKAGLFEAILLPLIKEFVSGATAEMAYNRELLQSLETPKQFLAYVKQQLHHPLSTAQQLALEYGIDVEALQEEFGEFFSLDLQLPDWMIEAALHNVLESSRQPYWDKVADTFGQAALTELEHGIQQGWSINRIAKELRQATADPNSQWIKTRAKNIARTESGHMLGAGAAAAVEQLKAETGLDIRKEWNSVRGSTSRESHVDNDGQLSDDKGMFNLDGYMIPWPSHISLPAKHRCNCQCFVTSVPMMMEE
jgi:hypothetical protein